MTATSKMIGTDTDAVFREFWDFSQKVLKAGRHGPPCYDSPLFKAEIHMPPHQVAYEFGEFHLDRDERVLRRSNVPVPLTPKATEILLTCLLA